MPKKSKAVVLSQQSSFNLIWVTWRLHWCADCHHSPVPGPHQAGEQLGVSACGGSSAAAVGEGAVLCQVRLVSLAAQAHAAACVMCYADQPSCQHSANVV